jgi:hypothetical protein
MKPGTAEVDGDATILAIKAEIYQNGPVTASFLVPYDFMYGSQNNYKWKSTNGIFISGSYDQDLNMLFPEAKIKNWSDIIIENGGMAGHAVEIVGWGVGDAGRYGQVPYWIIKNSWGTSFMDNGYFLCAINMSGTGYNSHLGLDIPTSVQNQVYQNGGCVKFDPDLDTGAPRGTSFVTRVKKNVLWIIIGIVMLVIVIGVTIYLYRRSYYSRKYSDYAPVHTDAIEMTRYN